MFGLVLACYYLTVIAQLFSQAYAPRQHTGNGRVFVLRQAAKVSGTIGPYSRASVLAKLDGRTKEARLVRETRAALTAHVGPNPSATQSVLIERAVQLTLRVATMDRKFAETGQQTEHDSRTYLAWSASLSRAMRDLGIKSAAQQPLSLREHMAARQAAASP